MSHSFPFPATCLISRGEATAGNFSRTKNEILNTIHDAAKAGVSLIQIREKLLPASFVFELAEAAAAIVAGTNTKLLINDRADIALAAGAAGVHLPSNSIPAAVARRFSSKDFIIGVSAHSLDEVSAARNAGANFVTFAPVFVTPNKGEPKGLSELARLCKAVSGFPVVALGGIDETNAEAAIRAGAAGIASIRALNDAVARSGIVDRLASLSTLK